MDDGLITAQAERLRTEMGLYPLTASEIEFTLIGSETGPAMDAFWADVLSACTNSNISVFKHEKERGIDQQEISLNVDPDAAKIARDTVKLKSIIAEMGARHGMQADFAAKPFADRPGNGLHIHVHLADKAGKNIFYKDDFRISDGLRFAIGGLMAWMPYCMPVFAPKPESYARFVPRSNTPLTVSWGANNRTTAIRLPQAAHDNKHIEHRVAGSDADPRAVLAVILAAMHYGLKAEINPGEQMFGDATLPSCTLPRLPLLLEEATKQMQASPVIAEYFKSEELLSLAA